MKLPPNEVFSSVPFYVPAQAVYWQYARVRWQQSGLRPGDEDFLELMDMAAQEYVFFRPSLADVPCLAD